MLGLCKVTLQCAITIRHDSWNCFHLIYIFILSDSLSPWQIFFIFVIWLPWEQLTLYAFERRCSPVMCESVQIWWHVCHCEEHIHHRDSYDTDMHWHAEWLKKLSVFVSIGWSSEIKYLLQFQCLASGNLSELFLPCFMYSFMSVHCVWYIRYFATG